MRGNPSDGGAFLPIVIMRQSPDVPVRAARRRAPGPRIARLSQSCARSPDRPGPHGRGIASGSSDRIVKQGRSMNVFGSLGYALSVIPGALAIVGNLRGG